MAGEDGEKDSLYRESAALHMENFGRRELLMWYL
jgi:hypothetical protein